MRRFWLPGILMLSFLLRVLWLEKYPVGFTPDEASFGYDAYSLLKTGKDQWGTTWPLVLQSFGDYKSPLYAYLTIPTVAIFGLNKFAVRLPNALFGTATVYVIYLLVNKLFSYRLTSYELNKKLTRNAQTRNRLTGLTTALLLAISPWHVMMSRGAFEANLTTFFLPLGIYLFLKGLENSKYLFWSSVILGLNLFSYHSAKFVTVLIVFALIFLFRKGLKSVQIRYLSLSTLLFFIFLLLTFYAFSLGAGSRIADVSILKTSLEPAARERIVLTKLGYPDFLARLVHNKYQVAARQFLKNYMSYFSPQFLFAEGPSETTYGMIPGRGVLYWFEAIFLAGFIFYISREKISKPLKVVILWFFIAPIPASLAIGPGYAANRAVVMIPAIQVISAIGTVYVFIFLKRILSGRALKVVSWLYCFVVLGFFAFFLEDYFTQSPNKQERGMLYGNFEFASWLSQQDFKEREIIVSRRLSEPHIYIAFSNKWDPNQYQKNTKEWKYKTLALTWLDQIPEYKLGNYLFRNIDWVVDSKRQNAILVGKPEEFPKETLPLKTFYYRDGTPAILVVNFDREPYAKNI